MYYTSIIIIFLHLFTSFSLRLRVNEREERVGMKETSVGVEYLFLCLCFLPVLLEGRFLFQDRWQCLTIRCERKGLSRGIKSQQIIKGWEGFKEIWSALGVLLEKRGDWILG
jgi:hypothetical protein